jgi:hypothetical protein
MAAEAPVASLAKYMQPSVPFDWGGFWTLRRRKIELKRSIRRQPDLPLSKTYGAAAHDPR